MKDQKDKASVPLLLQCGTCFHWAKVTPGRDGAPVTIGEPVRGVCWGAPPTASFVIDGRTGETLGQRNCRPFTRQTDRACGLWTPQDAVAAFEAANEAEGKPS